MALTADTARAILAQAKADEIYEGDIPEDDSTVVEEAQEMVDMARAAWDADPPNRGPEVEALLSLAANDENEGVEDEGEEVTAEATEEEGDESENLAEIEPWEGYDGEKVGELKAGIAYSQENDTEDDFRDLLAHIWEYESANKARSSVLSYLEEVGGATEAEAPADEDAGGDEGAADAAGEAGEDDAGDDAVEPEPDADDAGGEVAEPEPEEAPEPEAAPKTRKSRGAASAKTNPAESVPAVFVLTREEILEALATGSVEITV